MKWYCSNEDTYITVSILQSVFLFVVCTQQYWCIQTELPQQESEEQKDRWLFQRTPGFWNLRSMGLRVWRWVSTGRSAPHPVPPDCWPVISCVAVGLKRLNHLGVNHFIFMFETCHSWGSLRLLFAADAPYDLSRIMESRDVKLEVFYQTILSYTSHINFVCLSQCQLSHKMPTIHIHNYIYTVV